MKKLLMIPTLAVAMLFATQANAQVKKVEKKKDQSEMKASSAKMQMKSDYARIESTKLPKPVMEAVSKDFDGQKVSKAFMGKNKTYKLVLTDGKIERTVYANEKGEWVKPKK